MKLQIGIMVTLMLLLTLTVKRNISIRWLSLGKLTRQHRLETDGFTQAECDMAKKRKLFQRRHYKFCVHNKHRFAMHAVYMASKAAAYYCMKTFKDRRWNCKSVEMLPKVSPELELGTQEQAIVHAFSSASLFFEIARRCSQSKLQYCPCGSDNLENKVIEESKTPSYYSTNCPDNVAIGVEYTKKFLGYDNIGKSSRLKPSTPISKLKSNKERKMLTKKINAHNYAAGVEIMQRNWKSKCKCHGVSGSCANEVCFRQLRRLDDDVLLKQLKDQYLAAKYVVNVRKGHLITDQNVILKKTELAFIEHSSDYCSPDSKVGSVGTQNRQCETKNYTDVDTNHCSNMCCGRGYRKEIEQKTERCQCSLDQNFVVKCNFCTKIHEINFCL